MRSEEWDERFAVDEFLFTDQPNRTVVAEVGGLPAGRALEVAAGEGRNAVWLAEQGWTVTAVDFSRVALRKAARLAEVRGVEVSFVPADVLEWVPPVAAYDLVLVAYLQLPAAELSEVLAGAAAAVAPGGTLLVVGHDRDNLARGYGGPQDPDVLYAVDEITEALGVLRVDKAEQIDRLVETELGPRVAIDTLVRAYAPR